MGPDDNVVLQIQFKKNLTFYYARVLKVILIHVVSVSCMFSTDDSSSRERLLFIDRDP